MKSHKRGTRNRRAESPRTAKRSPLVFALEPRMMFDGAAVTSAAQAHVSADAHVNAAIHGAALVHANVAIQGAALAHQLAHELPAADLGRGRDSGRGADSARELPSGSLWQADTRILSSRAG